MSTYVSANVVLRANAQAQACAILCVEADAIEALEQARLVLQATEIDLTQLTTVLRDLPSAATAVLDKLAAPQMTQARELIHSGSRATSPPVVANNAIVRIREAIAAADMAMATARRKAIADETITFGRSRFDCVSVCEGRQVTAIVMRRGAQVSLSLVHADGRVEREYLGMLGESCQQADACYTAHMRSAGFDFDTTVEYPHGNQHDGARLIRAAAARDAESLARGAVLNAERPITSALRPVARGNTQWEQTDSSATIVTRQARGGAA